MKQYWMHLSGEIYALDIVDGVLKGVAGPLHYKEVGDLDNHNYDMEDIDWAMEHETEFTPYEVTA